MSRKRGAFALLPSMPWPGCMGGATMPLASTTGAGPICVVNIAALAAAANPRLPTPAIPAAPPLFVSGSFGAGVPTERGGDISGGV